MNFWKTIFTKKINLDKPGHVLGNASKKLLKFFMKKSEGKKLENPKKNAENALFGKNQKKCAKNTEKCGKLKSIFFLKEGKNAGKKSKYICTGSV